MLPSMSRPPEIVSFCFFLRNRRPRSGLKELVDIGVAQLLVADDVLAVVATELVGAGNVDDKMPGTANGGILDE